MRALRLVHLCHTVAAGLLLVACSEPVLNSKRQDEIEQRPTKESEIKKVNLAMIRAEVIGNVFRSLTLSNTTFSGVTITDINDQKIRFTHSRGFANIGWDQVDQKVKDRWGYDSDAFAKAQWEQQLTVAEREAYLDSPEYLQSQKEAEQAQEMLASAKIEKKRVTIEKKIAKLTIEKTQAEAALRILGGHMGTLKGTFHSEDSNASRIKEARNDPESDVNTIGGVVTSKADRNRAQKKIDDKVNLAERELEKLDLAIEAEKRTLRKLPSPQ